MTTILEEFVLSHPAVTLSHANYGQHFYLGRGVNILSSPTQCLRSFVEDENIPYRFVLVGQLSSFKVVEDTFGHFLSVNLTEPQFPSVFTEIFKRQVIKLEGIEEEDAKSDSVQSQCAQWRSSRGHVVFKAYDASKHPLSSGDIGSFVLAIVELRCLDVGNSLPAFARTYWIEALSLRPLSSHDPTDEEFIDKIVQLL